MRTAFLAVAGALGAAVACGGSNSPTFNSLAARDTPPASYDTPPPSADTPPSTEDTPPATGDPTPGNACIRCRGSYSCSDDGIDFTLMLSLANGVCNVLATANGMSLATIASCGAAATDAGADTSYSIDTNGTVTSCPANSSSCIVCTPGATPEADGGASIDLDAGSNASACASLTACCMNLPSEDQEGCENTVSDGDDTLCGSVLAGFTNAGLC